MNNSVHPQTSPLRHGGNSPGRSVAAVSSPASTLCIVEGTDDWNMDLCGWCGGNAFVGHSGMMNFLFLDSHAKSMKWSATFRPTFMWRFNNQGSDQEALDWSNNCTNNVVDCK